MNEETERALEMYHSPLPGDVKVLHTALDTLLALFIPLHGEDYSAVESALKALSMHYQELPTSVGAYTLIETRGYGRNKTE